MSNTKRAGRRERLLARKRPTLDYHLAVVDDTAAVAELTAAKEALEIARIAATDQRADKADQAISAAEERLKLAREAVQDCYEPIKLTALPPAEFEELAAAHPARDGKDEQWNSDTFPMACFLACVDTSELSADEWTEFLKTSVSQSERLSLFTTAIGVNARWPSGAVPND